MSEDFLSRISYLLPEEQKIVMQAQSFAEKAHQNQQRQSGENYFNHCYEVAVILTEIKMDSATIAAAFLHDILEDTGISADYLEKEFGLEVTNLVRGVTKLSAPELAPGEETEISNWRRMLLAVSRDVRTIFLKLADRLHNIRTIQYLSPERQQKIARETLLYYAPLAGRLGLYRWKIELEDRSFAVLEAEKYKEIENKISEQLQKYQISITTWEKMLKEKLAAYNIPFRLSSRPKNIYGIYWKMLRQKKSVEELDDIIGWRLITDTVANCYALLGIIHTLFQPIPNTFNDYIAVPKPNLYQSLHTTVVGPQELKVEFQIRTEQMHQIAEYGAAAHWRYKEQTQIGPDRMEKYLDWLKQLLDWQNDIISSREFLQGLSDMLEFEWIYTFTPKGKVIRLPVGATPVDFAYAIHSDIGDHCIGAKVNRKIRPLDYKLQSGEVVEILVRKNVSPNKDWLKFVKTPLARQKIRRFFRNLTG